MLLVIVVRKSEEYPGPALFIADRPFIIFKPAPRDDTAFPVPGIYFFGPL